MKPNDLGAWHFDVSVKNTGVGVRADPTPAAITMVHFSATYYSGRATDLTVHQVLVCQNSRLGILWREL